jgi:hypothetical protein
MRHVRHAVRDALVWNRPQTETDTRTYMVSPKNEISLVTADPLLLAHIPQLAVPGMVVLRPPAGYQTTVRT